VVCSAIDEKGTELQKLVYLMNAILEIRDRPETKPFSEKIIDRRSSHWNCPRSQIFSKLKAGNMETKRLKRLEVQ
jgi:hypothetical protein